MAVRYPITLNVSEPNNNIGLLKIRQADEETQTLVVQILEDAVPKSYAGLQVFFCARIGQTAGLGIIEQKLSEAEMEDPKNGILEYTFRAEDWQILGRQNGYFSFRKMTDDHTYVQQFSTRDFTYEVTKNVYSDGVKEVKKDGSTYIWTIEDLIRLFNEYIASGKSDWEEFVDQNKEIIESVDPGGQVLLELIEARGNYQSVKARFENVEGDLTNVDISEARSINGYLNDQISEVGGIIPDFYKDRLIEMSQSLKAGSFKILHITDNHNQMSSYAPNSLAHYMYAAMMTHLGEIDVFISNGDNINGYYDREQLLIETKQVTSTVFGRVNFKTDVFFNFGNHDNGAGQNGKNKPEQCISLDEIKNFYQTSSLIYGEIRDNDSLYCYKDYSDYKIRVIVLNSFDLPETTNSDGTFKYNFVNQSAFGGQQLKWLAEKALILPDSEWHVIIFSHACISGGLDEIEQFNNDELVQILSAYKEGSNLLITAPSNEFPVSLKADYTHQGPGTIIAFVSGHHHYDNSMLYQGFWNIESQASLCVGTGRESGTYTEDSWDVIEIDKENRKISMKRFGYGNDRTFDY